MRVIDLQCPNVKEKILAGAMNAARPLLPADLVETWCRELNHRWRERLIGPLVTLLACIKKHIEPGTSARDIEDWLASLAGAFRSRRDGQVFCQARARLPEQIFKRAVEHIGAEGSKHGSLSWRKRSVLYVDGTTMRAPRTKDNRRHLGHPSSIHGRSVLPVLRLVCLICAGCGAVIAAEIDSYFEAEMRLFLRLLPRLQRGSLIVADAAYISYICFWQLRERGCDALSHHDSNRRGRLIRRLGYHDELHLWCRPPQATSAFPELLVLTPQTQEVRLIRRSIRRRGYRTWTLVLCTTLLDPQTYSADDLAELYLGRWDIEGDIRSLKQNLQMARLSGQTAGIVRKEVYSGLLAYNLVRVMSVWSGSLPRAVSFERARELFVSFNERMSAAQTLRLPELFDRMLALIAEAQIVTQDRPPQPRAILQHRTCYPTLRVSRSQWLKNYYAA